MPQNDVVIDRDIQVPQEGIEVIENALSSKMSEDEFSRAVDTVMIDIDSYFKKIDLKKRIDRNYKYWVGDQVDETALRDGEEKYIDNAIFRNMETFLPIATARSPEMTATAVYKNAETRSYSQNIQRALQAEWEVGQLMQSKLSRGVRNHQLNLLGIFMYGYDEDDETFWTEEIHAKNVKISKDGRVIIRYIDTKTYRELIEEFPDKKSQILNQVGLKAQKAGKYIEKFMDSPATYIEVWKDNFVGWRLGDVVLGVDENPHFDHEGREIEMPTGEMMQQVNPETGAMEQVPQTKKVTIKYNHFKSPQKPFLFLTYFNSGLYVFDDTSLVEQAIGPQDWINKRKRQMGANADSTNGHWVSSGSYIDREEFDKIEGGIDEKIWLREGIPGEGIAKITGPALPDFIYTDLLDSRGSIDNLMGTHSTTRGESAGNPTATQDVMQRDQDFGRVDGYVRDGIEVFAQKWFEAMYHMYLVYTTEDRSIAIPEDDDFETDNVIFSRDRVPLIEKENGDVIPVPMLIRVKQGSTLPRDEVQEYVRAKEIKDMLAPMDYFKMIGMPNPRELTKNALIWAQDPFMMFQDDEDIQVLIQKQQEEQMAAAAAAGGGAPPLDPGALSPDAAGGQPPMDPGMMEMDEGAVTEEGVMNAMVDLMRGGGAE